MSKARPSFYTFAEQLGTRIFHRYVDENGIRHDEVVSEFPIELFIESPNGKDLGCDGKKLGKVNFTNIKDAKEFYRAHNDATAIYGQTNYVYQFISHVYSSHVDFAVDRDISKFRVFDLDIEVVKEDGFPDPTKAEAPITLITIKNRWGSNDFVSFGFDEDSRNGYTKFSDEKSMLLGFLDYWQTNYPDILTGWNINGFDIPYLVNRITNVLGEAFARKLSPFHSYTKNVLKEIELKETNDPSYTILGITSMDYLQLYKKYTYGNREQYTLNYIAHIEIGEAKVDYSEVESLNDLYFTNFPKYLDYNIHDVRLVEKLDDKLQFLVLAITMTFMAKSRFDDVFSSTRFWDAMLFNHLRFKGMQVSPHDMANRGDDERIQGAFVMDPIIGLQKWLVSFDLTSLYPSIIMSFNLSPDTHIQPAERQGEESAKYIDKLVNDIINGNYEHEADLKEQGSCALANGARFATDHLGFMPEKALELFLDRKTTKKEMIGIKQENELLAAKINDGTASEEDVTRHSTNKNRIAALDARQMALKIALNSLYGAQACKWFRYFNRDIAEGITTTGQAIIKYTKACLNAFLNKKFGTDNIDFVVAGDTDSVGGESEVLLDSNGSSIRIDDLWKTQTTEVVKRGKDDEIRPVHGIFAEGVDKNGVMVNKPIKYIMRHKVKKRMFMIRAGGKQVRVTEDHSIMVKRDENIISVKPMGMKQGDVVIMA